MLPKVNFYKNIFSILRLPKNETFKFEELYSEEEACKL